MFNICSPMKVYIVLVAFGVFWCGCVVDADTTVADGAPTNNAVQDIVSKILTTLAGDKDVTGKPGDAGEKPTVSKSEGLGVMVPAGKYSWHVAIADKEAEVFCSGALVDKKWVVTAARCFDKGEPQVYMGLLSWSDGVVPSEIKKHSEYDSETKVNDIAMVRLPEAVEDTMIPIAINKDMNQTFVGEKAMITSYQFVLGADSVNSVRKADVTIINTTRCSEILDNNLDLSTICTVNSDKSEMLCYVDYGSPLTVIDDGQELLLGFYSYEIKLGCPTSMPYVYESVAHHKGFIEEMIESTSGASLSAIPVSLIVLNLVLYLTLEY